MEKEEPPPPPPALPASRSMRMAQYKPVHSSIMEEDESLPLPLAAPPSLTQEPLAPAPGKRQSIIGAPPAAQGSARDSWNFVLSKGGGPGRLQSETRSAAEDLETLMSVSDTASVAPKAASLPQVQLPPAPGKRQSVMPSQGSARDSWNYVLQKGDDAQPLSSARELAPRPLSPRRSETGDSMSLMSVGHESDAQSLVASVVAPLRAAQIPQAPGKRQSLYLSQS